jgi:hypothetical protein
LNVRIIFYLLAISRCGRKFAIAQSRRVKFEVLRYAPGGPLHRDGGGQAEAGGAVGADPGIWRCAGGTVGCEPGIARCAAGAVLPDEGALVAAGVFAAVRGLGLVFFFAGVGGDAGSSCANTGLGVSSATVAKSLSLPGLGGRTPTGMVCGW